MAVTIYDIAKEVGTSTSTVSRVINGSSLIGDDLTSKILETANKLGYKKRNIRKQRSRAIINIKLVLGQLSDPSLPLFYSVTELIDSIKNNIQNNQLNIICETGTKPEDLFASKQASNVDAIIFAFCHIPKKTISFLNEANIPFLALNREIPEADFITYQNSEEMYRLSKKVIATRQSPKALFLEMNPDHEVTIERRKGFLLACAEMNVSPKVHPLKSLNEITEEFIEYLFDEGYYSVICMNDIIATSFIINSLQSCHKVPRDFSVSGFDGSSITAVLPKKLCTVKLDMNILGEKSGEWVQKRIIDREEPLIQLRLLGNLVLGQTL